MNRLHDFKDFPSSLPLNLVLSILLVLDRKSEGFPTVLDVSIIELLALPPGNINVHVQPCCYLANPF